ncbi:MAG: hypothetical protein WCH43_14375 [Verrucomicrobiota bacterium]
MKSESVPFRIEGARSEEHPASLDVARNLDDHDSRVADRLFYKFERQAQLSP